LPKRASKATFNADGTLVVINYIDETSEVRTTDGAVVTSMRRSSFSPDERRLMTCADSLKPQCELRQVSDGALIRALAFEDVLRIQWSTSGRFLTVDDRTAMTLFRAQTGDVVARATAVRFLPRDFALLELPSGRSELWDVQSGKALTALDGVVDCPRRRDRATVRLVQGRSSGNHRHGMGCVRERRCRGRSGCNGRSRCRTL
jgi:hypothetical protein